MTLLQIETGLKAVKELSSGATQGGGAGVIYVLISLVFVMVLAFVWLGKLYIDQQKDRLSDKDNVIQSNREDLSTLIATNINTQKEVESLVAVSKDMVQSAHEQSLKMDKLTVAITHMIIGYNGMEQSIDSQLKDAMIKVNHYKKRGENEQVAFWQSHAENLSKVMSNKSER